MPGQGESADRAQQVFLKAAVRPVPPDPIGPMTINTCSSTRVHQQVFINTCSSASVQQQVFSTTDRRVHRDAKSEGLEGRAGRLWQQPVDQRQQTNTARVGPCTARPIGRSEWPFTWSIHMRFEMMPWCSCQGLPSQAGCPARTGECDVHRSAAGLVLAAQRGRPRCRHQPSHQALGHRGAPASCKPHAPHDEEGPPPHDEVHGAATA